MGASDTPIFPYRTGTLADLTSPPPQTRERPGLAWAAGLAAFLATAVIGWVIFRVAQMNRELSKPEAVAERIAESQKLWSRRQAARRSRGLTSAGDSPITEEKVPKITTQTPLSALGDDWSFSESWVANVTLGATALIGLLAASDVLKAVLGAEPKAALGLIAVASALAAVLVGLGTLILKAVGEEAGTPTVGGTVAAGALVLSGSLLQVVAVTIQGARLAGGALVVVPLTAGCAVGALLILVRRPLDTGIDSNGHQGDSAEDAARSQSSVDHCQSDPPWTY